MECRPAGRDPAFFVDGKFNINQQRALEDKRANCILGHKHSIASQSTEVIVPLYSALVRPHLEYCAQFWAPQHEDIKKLECAQRAPKRW